MCTYVHIGSIVNLTVQVQSHLHTNHIVCNDFSLSPKAAVHAPTVHPLTLNEPYQSYYTNINLNWCRLPPVDGLRQGGRINH